MYRGYLLIVGLVICARGNETGPNGPYFAVVLQNDAHNSTSNNETDETDLVRGKELVDEALIPVYDMTNFFLEDIVQQNDLNYMAERGVDFSDLDAIVNSFENDYEEWVQYGIGESSFRNVSNYPCSSIVSFLFYSMK